MKLGDEPKAMSRLKIAHSQSNISRINTKNFRNTKHIICVIREICGSFFYISPTNITRINTKNFRNTKHIICVICEICGSFFLSFHVVYQSYIFDGSGGVEAAVKFCYIVAYKTVTFQLLFDFFYGFSAGQGLVQKGSL